MQEPQLNQMQQWLKPGKTSFFGPENFVFEGHTKLKISWPQTLSKFIILTPQNRRFWGLRVWGLRMFQEIMSLHLLLPFDHLLNDLNDNDLYNLYIISTNLFNHLNDHEKKQKQLMTFNLSLEVTIFQYCKALLNLFKN